MNPITPKPQFAKLLKIFLLNNDNIIKIYVNIVILKAIIIIIFFFMQTLEPFEFKIFNSNLIILFISFIYLSTKTQNGVDEVDIK